MAIRKSSLSPFSQDERFMARALALAWCGAGRTNPNPPVGAVVVRQGTIVGAGYHRRAGGPHAEVMALRQAGRLASGATLCVTLDHQPRGPEDGAPPACPVGCDSGGHRDRPSGRPESHGSHRFFTRTGPATRGA